MWTDWPLRGTDWLHKWYYLVQFAFWLQQIVVLHIEERRKDHYQMLAHHIITCSLMAGSYAYHLTRVGNVILCIMDFVDILLPVRYTADRVTFSFKLTYPSGGQNLEVSGIQYIMRLCVRYIPGIMGCAPPFCVQSRSLLGLG